jgi:uncharacterized protein (TIGR03083 family)
MDLSHHDLLRVGFDATRDRRDDLPAGLGERLVAQGLAVRPARHPGWEGRQPLGSLDAFITTASEVAAVLDTVSPEQLTIPTRVENATIGEIVEHLVGVERYVLGQLGRAPSFGAPRREDHWPVARHAARNGRSEGERLAGVWWREALGVIAACGELGPDHLVAYHHLYGPVDGLLVVRTFEVWTHGDDILGALGRPLQTLDDTRLALMVGQLMDVLPLGLALAGCTQPGRTARFVLSEPDMAVDVALAPGEPPGPPDITISVDVIQLCRLAANRLASGQLGAGIEGDTRLLEPILAGATAFAAD